MDVDGSARSARRLPRYDADVDALLGGLDHHTLRPESELITYKSLRLVRERTHGDGESVLVCKEPSDDSERYRWLVVVGMLTWGFPDVSEKRRERVETRHLSRPPKIGQEEIELLEWLDELDDVEDVASVEDVSRYLRVDDPRPERYDELESTERAPIDERIERFRRMRGVEDRGGELLGELAAEWLGIDTSTSRSALIGDDLDGEGGSSP